MCDGGGRPACVPIGRAQRVQGDAFRGKGANLAPDRERLPETAGRIAEPAHVVVGDAEAREHPGLAHLVPGFSRCAQPDLMRGDPVVPRLAEGEVAGQRRRQLPRGDVVADGAGLTGYRDQIRALLLAPPQRVVVAGERLRAAAQGRRAEWDARTMWVEDRVR